MVVVWRFAAFCIQETSCVWETGSVHPAWSGLIKHRLERSLLTKIKLKKKKDMPLAKYILQSREQRADNESIFCKGQRYTHWKDCRLRADHFYPRARTTVS